jgi:hypothetical protein
MALIAGRYMRPAECRAQSITRSCGRRSSSSDGRLQLGVCVERPQLHNHGLIGEAGRLDHSPIGRATAVVASSKRQTSPDS